MSDQYKILISSFTALYTNLQSRCDLLRSNKEIKQQQPKQHLRDAAPAKAAGQAGMCAWDSSGNGTPEAGYKGCWRRLWGQSTALLLLK